MDVAVRRLSFVKIGCFAHTLNPAAQKLYTEPTISRWAARIRDVVVWLKEASLAKPVLKEKQRLRNLPEHALVLDVRTRWNTLYVMFERFVEQYPAIQAASMDIRLRRSMERDRLERFTDQDYRQAEDFVSVIKILYTSTFCVSSEKTPTLVCEEQPDERMEEEEDDGDDDGENATADVIPVRLIALEKLFAEEDRALKHMAFFHRTVWYGTAWYDESVPHQLPVIKGMMKLRQVTTREVGKISTVKCPASAADLTSACATIEMKWISKMSKEDRKRKPSPYLRPNTMRLKTLMNFKGSLSLCVMMAIPS
ncbi:hypothetical protein AAFF_G00391490 [Aldrovandia affinis]|uniref:Uncharacterized protein n=1 Tax=Aldrovandia affinis TaxID=143900 RepID=A0AAD7SE33_9TELE|nr:hypothetical protein AAFF_G00391490 [Aldrovandia affinis]